MVGPTVAPTRQECRAEASTSNQHHNKAHTEMELMKEKFAKLLLGEDMSGGGKGVSSALALSNAITNLAASVFGEQCRLEPMSAERKARWRKEIGWLLSVTEHIVEFAPSQQRSENGEKMEIMVTKQRSDLHMSIPALRKLDAILIENLDSFRDQEEFWYGGRGEGESEKDVKQRKDDKWWLPTVRVPPEGLSEETRKWLQFQKESVNQVLKAAMAINSQVLSEMDIPESYIDSLPKNGKTSLGDTIYKSITIEYFDPEDFLSTMDLSTEHKVLDLKNKIEASIVIWKRKMNKDGKSSSWGSAVSLEKRELFEERAETVLLLLKQQFPGLPQSSLDISKIQYNRDVGQSILESYSRIIETLAYTITSKVDDVLYEDKATRVPSSMDERYGSTRSGGTEGEEGPASMSLSDFMKLDVGRGRLENEEKKSRITAASILTNLKVSYMDKLEHFGGQKSPSYRH